MPAVWLQMMIIGGGAALALTPAAIAETVPSDGGATASGDQARVYSAQDLLLPSQAGSGIVPTATAVPETGSEVARPAFSPLRASPSVGMNSPASSSSRQMQVPAPPPAPVSIISQAPAAAPSAPAPMDAAVTTQTTPMAAGSQTDSVVPSELAADDSVPPGFNSVFIDPTDYSLGATETPDRPDLVFAERSSGCEITVTAGAAPSGQSCGTSQSTPVAAAPDSGEGVHVGPISIDHRGLSINGTTVVSREFFNQKAQLLNVLRPGNQRYVYPLTIPAQITSLFGWRVHPLFGDMRFHSGEDLAAPAGTPVLATRDGRVAISDFLGGYGLTVILRHDNNQLESRYAHLSQIFVQPGEMVKQGDVIGLVGSTGNSTGPHLHFEMRQLTAQGWTVVDPREVLQYGLAGLMEIVNNPLQAMALTGDGDETAAPAADLPYRPAQPNAS